MNLNESPLRIGFMYDFPVKEILHTEILSGLEVSLAIVTFGSANTNKCFAVVTESLTEKARKNGGKYEGHHHPDGMFMEQIVMDFCEKHNITICDKICSWPFCKVTVNLRGSQFKHLIKNLQNGNL